jgi:hypothetical protein
MSSKNRMVCRDMLTLSHLSDRELLARLPEARATERLAVAKMIAYLAEVDRRRLYLAEACSSLLAFCVERLGYSENEAQKRIQVARLYRRLPEVLNELENGSIHLTGLFLLSAHLTDENAAPLIAEARGRTKREIESIVARWFPRPDVLPSITPLLSAASDASVAIPGNGSAAADAPEVRAAPSVPLSTRLQPLSAASYHVEFTASAQLFDKIEEARNLLSHAIPRGDLALLFERALDELLRAETKRRLGAGRPRPQRMTKSGSRHVPLEVGRAVWERDEYQCTFTDAQGRRCSERRFITIEHREPFARGGPATVDNLCLLCRAHNAERAREEFGEAYLGSKRLERVAYEKTLIALVELGFERRRAKVALKTLRERRTKAEVEPLLRAALGLLVPDAGVADPGRSRIHAEQSDRRHHIPPAHGHERAVDEARQI